ncbi:PRTRC system ThiF family protein [Mucilaginibacter sp. UYCu711]|uniref:PRTRC system ThiF family protein n=1 Tax=Mucilaginibacter sp. UYCu711 TaxID=3156339 RepID=UPI003D247185
MKTHYIADYFKSPMHPIHVSLIGVGGTGSQVLSALAKMHLSLQALNHPGLHVTAFDDDIVTDANIARQLYTQSDIGLNKAVISIQRVNRFFSIGWEAVPQKFDNRVEQIGNIIISCVDTAKGRLEIERVIQSSKKGNATILPYYWLDYGNLHKTGQVVLGTVGEIKQPTDGTAILPSITEMFDLTLVNEEDQGPSCSLVEALEKQDLFINSTLANLGANLLWNLFRDGQINFHGLFLNLKSLKVNPIPIK